MSQLHEVHFEGKIAQKAIIVQDDKVLLMRDPREVGEVWEIPGGRMNIDEEPRAALNRELYEEMGVHCVIHEVIYMKQFLQGNEGKRAFVIVYRATLQDEQASFNLDQQEVLEVRWVTQEELSELNLFPEYKEALATFFSQNNT